MTFYPLPCYSPLLGPNILLNALFSNTVSLSSSFNVSDNTTTTITSTINMSYAAWVILAYYELVALLLRLDGSCSFNDAASIAYAVSLIMGE
jgi:hypothetical protein